MDFCEICRKKLKTDNHHIHSLSMGGPDVNWNKCEVCPNCHREIHSGVIILEGKFASTSNRGYSLVYRKMGEESITGFEDPPVWLYPDCKRLLDIKIKEKKRKKIREKKVKKVKENIEYRYQPLF